DGGAAREHLCAVLRIARGRGGTWFCRGSPSGRKPLLELSASLLRREGDDYWLVKPAERGKIKVDEVPFTAVEVNAAGSGRSQALTFRTHLDDEGGADAQHPIRVGHAPDGQEPRPYNLVADPLAGPILPP